MKLTYHTLVSIDATKEQRRDLVLLEIQPKWRLSTPESRQPV